MRQPYSEFTSRPDDGCYIHGLFVEGARWDMDTFELEESRPKELYTDMPVMWLIPTTDRKQPESGMCMCPVYKTLRVERNMVLFDEFSVIWMVDPPKQSSVSTALNPLPNEDQ